MRIRDFFVSLVAVLAASSAATAQSPPLGTLIREIEGDVSDTLQGYSVATAGDVNGDGFSDLLIGAVNFDGDLFGEGRVQCFHGGPNGLAALPAWAQEGDVDNGEFGYSVSSAGDVNGDGYSDIVVGARRMGDDQPGEGFVFFYLGSPTGLSITASQFFDSDENAAFLGNSVSAAGDVDGDGFCDVIVGARLMDYLIADGGAAFLFRGFGGGVTAPTWQAGSDQHAALFGYSVTCAGDVNADGFADVAVGAYESSDGVLSEGQVFAFYGSASGLSVTPSWVGDVNHPFAHLGFSVRGAGDVDGDGFSDLLAGAPEYTGAITNQGAAFLFRGGVTGLAVVPAWSAEGKSTVARFGHAVASAGDVNGDGISDVVIGADSHEVTLSGDEGRVEVYLGSSGGVALTPRYAIEGSQPTERLGYSVATAGDVNGDGRAEVVVGAPFFAQPPDYDEGHVLVFAGGTDDLSDAAVREIAGDSAGESFGASLAAVFDVDGDGRFDVIAGAPQFDDGAALDAGRVRLLRGAPTGFEPAAWQVIGPGAGAQLGAAIAGAGDVNGDGFSDVLVGGAVANGAAIYHGLPAAGGSLAATPSATLVPTAAHSEVGSRVAGAGDLNGDGFGDVLLRAQRASDGGFDVLVFLGSASGIAPTPALVVSLPANVGAIELAAGGDLDGDGLDDFAIGAPNAAPRGAAWFYRVTLGTGGTLEATVFSQAIGSSATDAFGAALAIARDLDGDGFSEVAVGAPGFDGGGIDAGRVSVYRGGVAGPLATASSVHDGVSPGLAFGTTVASAGDVDGDGFADLAIGSVASPSAAGRVDLHRGAPSGLAPQAAFTRIGAAGGDRLGAAVAGGVDSNGDGFADLAIGIPGADNGGVDAGAVALHAGGGGLGRSVAPRLLRPGTSDPVAPNGLLTTANLGFEVAAGTTYGRGGVSVEWQAGVAGTPLGGAGTIASTALGEYVDSASAPAIGAASTSLSNGENHYRFRLRYDPTTTPFAIHGPWFAAPFASRSEATIRTVPTDALLAVTPSAGLALSGAVGGVVVETLLEVKNLGGSPLSWTVSELVDTEWLTLLPAGGPSLLASDGAIDVKVECNPAALAPGQHVTTLLCANVFDAAQTIEVPVSFAVGAVRFEPGDRVDADLAVPGDRAIGEFEGVAGMKLKLSLVIGGGAGSKYDVSVLDLAGGVVATKSITPSTSQVNLKLESSGLHRLLITRTSGAGAVAFATGRKLPAAASSAQLTLKKGKENEKTVAFAMLAGGEIGFVLKPNSAFEGLFDASLELPDGAALAVADLGAPLANGGYSLAGFAAPETGEYRIRFHEFAGTKAEKVKVTLDLEQPAIGNAIVVLGSLAGR
jgi:FG-GAP repeat